MKEVYGNLWKQDADAYVITTNGVVKKNGACVMGRGIALQAKQKFHEFDLELGSKIKAAGNNVYMLYGIDANNVSRKHWTIYSLPVKKHWHDKADLKLIEKSVIQLVYAVDVYGMPVTRMTDGPLTIVMPRPGCGNGQLKWSEVKPIIEPYLDDRFTIVEWRKGK